MSDDRLPRHHYHFLMVRAALGVLVFAIAGASSECFAQPTATLDLSWEAPPSCPQRADVEKELRQLLGEFANDRQQQIIHAKGVVVPKGEQFELTLQIVEGDSSGRRVIVSDHCSNLDRAAAVVLGLLIRRRQGLIAESSSNATISSAANSTNQSETAPPSLVASITQTGRKREPLPRDADEGTRETWRSFLLRPNLAADLWTLPEANFGIGLAAGLHYSHWQLALSGMWWRTQSTDSSEGSPFAASFQRQSIEAYACRGWSFGVFEVAPCVLLVLDHISARASGDRLSSQTQSAFPVSVGIGALSYWHTGRWGSVVVGATGRLMTSRPEFMVEDLIGTVGTERVHRLPWGTIVTTVGYEWIF
jgi:hypothetical protein